jgi:hypothetical protein
MLQCAVAVALKALVKQCLHGALRRRPEVFDVLVRVSSSLVVTERPAAVRSVVAVRQRLKLLQLGPPAFLNLLLDELGQHPLEPREGLVGVDHVEDRSGHGVPKVEAVGVQRLAAPVEQLVEMAPPLVQPKAGLDQFLARGGVRVDGNVVSVIVFQFDNYVVDPSSRPSLGGLIVVGPRPPPATRPAFIKVHITYVITIGS